MTLVKRPETSQARFNYVPFPGTLLFSQLYQYRSGTIS